MSEILLSQRVEKIKASATLALASKARELKAEGKDVISLSVGEPDWNSFGVATQAGINAIQEGLTKYMPSNGLLQLREAIADQVNSDLGVDYQPGQVTVTSGGKFTLHSLMTALLHPGDEVIIPAPYWVSYPTLVEMSEGVAKLVSCNKETQFKMTAELLESALSSKTKAVILNSPSNPTGEMYSQDELKSLARVFKAHPQVIIISDDIYNRLVFGELNLAPHILQVEPSLKERLIIVNGVSKTYWMTGWRLGWAIGPQNVIAAMNKYQSQTVSCASSIAQYGALAAITQGSKELLDTVSVLEERRDFVESCFNKVPGLQVDSPQGAFYFWPDISSYLGKSWQGNKIESSRCFAKYLLESQSVVAVPGVEFGLEGYLRVSYALSKERMKEAIERIAQFVSELS